MGVQDSDITITDYPLRALEEPGKIQPVDDTDGAITTPGANNSADGVIVEHLLEIALALIVGAGKLIIGSEKMIPQHHFQSPGFEDTYGGLHLDGRDFPGRGNESDSVAFFKVWRCYHLFMLRKAKIVIKIYVSLTTLAQ